MNIPREAMKLKKRMYELSRGSRLPVTFSTDFFLSTLLLINLSLL